MHLIIDPYFLALFARLIELSAGKEIPSSNPGHFRTFSDMPLRDTFLKSIFAKHNHAISPNHFSPYHLRCRIAAQARVAFGEAKMRYAPQGII